jgi:hypothetical protein
MRMGRSWDMPWKDALWSEEEIGTLREVWPRESRRTILTRLPNRSWYSIASKASALGIRRLRASEPLDEHRVLLVGG